MSVMRGWNKVWKEAGMTREDIDNIIKVICPNNEDFEKPCISPAYLKNELEALALEQEPKTGHWIEYTRVLIPEPINEWEQAWYCSECGYGNQECEDGSAWLEWKYCPNCGAKMVAPQESEGSDADCN